MTRLEKGHLADLGVGRAESHIFLWGEDALDGASRGDLGAVRAVRAVGQHPRGWICALLAVLNPKARRKKGVQARLSLGDGIGVGVGVGTLQEYKQRDGITRLVL